MDLQRASSYFSNTPVSGWNGSSWDSDIAQVTFLPHDRFISEREFGNKRRYVLSQPCSEALDTYKVIRLDPTQEVFLVGVKNYDVRENTYSELFLLHRAPVIADLVEYTKTTSASGMSGTAVRTVIGQVHCDVERITFSRSKEFDNTRFSEVSILLPLGTLVDTGNELVVGSDYYDVQEAYEASGFVYCRALAKRSS